MGKIFLGIFFCGLVFGQAILRDESRVISVKDTLNAASVDTISSGVYMTTWPDLGEKWIFAWKATKFGTNVQVKAVLRQGILTGWWKNVTIDSVNGTANFSRVVKIPADSILDGAGFMDIILVNFAAAAADSVSVDSCYFRAGRSRR